MVLGEKKNKIAEMKGKRKSMRKKSRRSKIVFRDLIGFLFKRFDKIAEKQLKKFKSVNKDKNMRIPFNLIANNREVMLRLSFLRQTQFNC